MRWRLPTHSTRNALTDVLRSFFRLIRLLATLPFLLTIFQRRPQISFPLVCASRLHLVLSQFVASVEHGRQREPGAFNKTLYALSALYWVNIETLWKLNLGIKSRCFAWCRILHKVQLIIADGVFQEKQSCICSSATKKTKKQAARSDWRWPLKTPATWNRHKIYGCFQLVTGDLYLQ